LALALLTGRCGGEATSAAGRKSRGALVRGRWAQPARGCADIAGTLVPGVAMKRLLAFFVCTCAVGAAIASCGGGENYDRTVTVDKLTVVGAGS